LAVGCGAREHGTAGQLPVKLWKTQPVEIEGVLLIVCRDGQVLLRRRDNGEPDGRVMVLPSAVICPRRGWRRRSGRFSTRLRIVTTRGR